MILVSNDDRIPYGCQDSSAATENIFLAAASYGIGTVWVNALMHLRKHAPVKEMLDKMGIPENHTIWSCICMGYPVSDGAALARKEHVVFYPDRSEE